MQIEVAEVQEGTPFAMKMETKADEGQPLPMLIVRQASACSEHTRMNLQEFRP